MKHPKSCCPVMSKDVQGSARHCKTLHGLRKEREVIFSQFAGRSSVVVRTPACHAGGFEFESHRSRFPFCPVSIRAVREIDDLREAAQFARLEVRMNSIVLHSSVPPDNEHRLIINANLFANLAQMIIFFYSVFEQCIADVSCRQHVVVAHDVFKLLSFLLVAAVITSVGVKEENVPWTHQR